MALKEMEPMNKAIVIMTEFFKKLMNKICVRSTVGKKKYNKLHRISKNKSTSILPKFLNINDRDNCKYSENKI